MPQPRIPESFYYYYYYYYYFVTVFQKLSELIIVTEPYGYSNVQVFKCDVCLLVC